MKIIGERLRGLRESVRLSQAKLAKEFDVSQSALARYEIADSTPSPEVFLKYADYQQQKRFGFGLPCCTIGVSSGILRFFYF